MKRRSVVFREWSIESRRFLTLAPLCSKCLTTASAMRAPSGKSRRASLSLSFPAREKESKSPKASERAKAAAAEIHAEDRPSPPSWS